MSLAAYSKQSALPSYVAFEPAGGQNGGSAWVLYGQASGQPTIMRPRVTPIQEANMSVAIEATVNTLNMSASGNGYEGVGLTLELLRIDDDGSQTLWTNALIGSQRYDLWNHEARDYHKLTWIQEIPQLGADLLNIGLVAKFPSGYVKVENLSLVNHYARYYESITGGVSNQISLTLKSQAFTFRKFRGFSGFQTIRATYNWYESYLDTMPMTILKGEYVTQTVTALIGCVSDSDTDVPIELGIMIKYRSRSGAELFQEVATIKSDEPVIDNVAVTNTVSWTAQEDYTQAEPILFVKTKFGRVHGTTASHEGIHVDISTRRSLFSSSS